jgi:dipeptidyl aminopeptidase/acylaminoacyl peptidase
MLICNLTSRDIRESSIYREAEEFACALRRPGAGQISDIADIHVSPDAQSAVFTGTIVQTLEGLSPSKVYQISLVSGEIQVLAADSNTDRLPLYSPHGERIAFLSDRHDRGIFQLFLLDLASGKILSAPRVEGSVEYFHWSPNGKWILVGVAALGADSSSSQGGTSSPHLIDSLPSWMPRIESAKEYHGWRQAWVYEIDGGGLRRVGRADGNVWKAVWCGHDAIAAVVSASPDEGSWYHSTVKIIGLDGGDSRVIYTPKDQLGSPAASPSGAHLAVLEALCSDRGLVAGDLRLIETRTGHVRNVNTLGVDITYVEWRSDRKLLLAGNRGPDTVVGLFDVAAHTFSEVWSSREISTGGYCVSVSGLDEEGGFALAAEAFTKGPEIAVVRSGQYHLVRSFDLGYAEQAKAISIVESLNWYASDGVEIQGWLLRPNVLGPSPTIAYLHGGPVWHWRPTCLRGGTALLLVKRGYTVFLPNPRGSSGRGQAFARHVLADMGGADARDILAGLDYLVEQRIADPQHLGVMGTSYGGFLTCWLTSLNPRFRAAVAIVPIVNHVTHHLLSNIPHFVTLFLGCDTYSDPAGRFYRCSPIMYAHRVRTPTLSICGALDRSAPPEEAAQWHNALRENDVESMLVTYPEEGHGVHGFPAQIDCVARIVSWLDTYLHIGQKLGSNPPNIRTSSPG